MVSQFQIGSPDQSSITLVNFSAVAWSGRGLLLTGKSGSGKSALCLELMAYGAGLICDDGVTLTRRDEQVFVTCPERIRGKIEARGIGILAADYSGQAALSCVVDLDRVETARMPKARYCEVLGQRIPLIASIKAPHFPASLLQLLKGGRVI